MDKLKDMLEESAMWQQSGESAERIGSVDSSASAVHSQSSLEKPSVTAGQTGQKTAHKFEKQVFQEHRYLAWLLYSKSYYMRIQLEARR